MIRTAAILLCAVTLSGCGYWSATATPYAGEPGSVFDSSGPMRPVMSDPVYAPTPMPQAAAPVNSLPPTSQVPGAAPRPQ